MTGEAFRTAEMEETARVMSHIQDLNQAVAEEALGACCEAMPHAVRRLQQLPFALAAFRFDDAEFWRARISEQEMMSAHSRQPQPDTCLARHLLSIAWHCGRASVGPRLLLGIGREVGELITTLRFSQLDDIALRHAADVHRRWSEVPRFWPQMLEAACDEEETRWSRFQLHALRLLGRERQ
ncbi:hypothetical protein [Povalibacter sp.]|uniref:hypothetical protein n=1 Tax=Povalibacter sp. TaxID=1962978 RepID=UPI002F407C38